MMKKNNIISKLSLQKVMLFLYASIYIVFIWFAVTFFEYLLQGGGRYSSHLISKDSGVLFTKISLVLMVAFFTLIILKDRNKRNILIKESDVIKSDFRARMNIANLFLRVPGDAAYPGVLETLMNFFGSDTGFIAYRREDECLEVKAQYKMDNDIFIEGSEIDVVNCKECPDQMLKCIEEKEIVIEQDECDKEKDSLYIPFIFKGNCIGVAYLCIKGGMSKEKIIRSSYSIAEYIAPLMHSKYFTMELENEKLFYIDQLKESESKYRMMFNSVNDAIFLMKLKDDGTLSNFIEVNDIACERLGYSKEELLKMSPADIDFKESFKNAGRVIEEIMKNKNVVFEMKNISKDGTVIPVEINSKLFEHNGENIIISISRDITKRLEQEKDLRIKETSIENSVAAMSFSDMDGKIIYANRSFVNLWGYKDVKEVLGKNIIEFGADPDSSGNIIQELIEKGGYQGQIEAKRKNGNTFHMHMLLGMNKNERGEPVNIVGSFIDVTDAVYAQERVKNSLKEKDDLLKELHHRVKNNLQIINSLLRMQAESIENESGKAALNEARSRIMSMSAVHERVYTSGESESLNMGEYLGYLSEQIVNSYSASERKIHLRVDVQNVYIETSKAVPLGLIVNELVSNSCKHALGERNECKIIICFEVDGKGNAVLSVEDDGPGFDVDSINSNKTIGLELIFALVKQIKGKYTVHVENGTKFVIVFREKR